MYEGIFDGLHSLIKWILIILCVSVPLGIWKMIEIFIWLFNSIEIGLK